jgi:filamentous hemagglutinin family protein
MMQNARTLLTTSCLTAAICLPFAASANPQDGIVTAGQAVISQAGKKLDIHQQSDKAVIDWRGFDITPDEHTEFHQPDSSSIALNRVNSNTPSNLNGKLTANGNVVIVNQNGVMFGRGAQIDVNGLVATTADIDNDKFMNDKTLAFDKKGKANAAIINEGTITAKEAGLVGFVAPNVVNDGVITANLGRVQLASGDTAAVDMYGDGLMQIAVSDDVKSQLVANTGIIKADGGKIALTASAGKNIVNSLIVAEGALKAQSVGVKNGEIIISAAGSNAVENNIAADKGKKQGLSLVKIENANLDVSGRDTEEKGGSITVTADNITVGKDSTLNAGGHSGGGNIRVGGDYQGGGVTPAAKRTEIEQGALLDVSALHSGDAGEAIIWSDGNTYFHGTALARGGSISGDGGLVEVSGKEFLRYKGYVNTLAPNGETGLLLLDPADIVILDGSGDGDDADGSSTSTNTTVAGGDVLPTQIYESELEGIAAGTAISLTSTNSITINDLSDNLLNLDQNVTFSTGAGGFTMSTGDAINSTGSIDIITTGGTHTIGSLGGNGAKNLNIVGTATASGVISGSGSLTKNGAGTLTLSGANTYSGATNVNGGTLLVSGQPYFNIGRTTTIASGATFELTNSNNSFTSQMPLSTILGAGTLRFSGASSLSQSSGGTSNQNRFVMSQSAGGLLDLQGTTSINNGGWQNINWTSNLGSLNIDTGASMNILDGNAVRIDALTGAGAITKTLGGTVNLTLGVNGGSGTFSGTISNASGSISVTKNGAGTQTFSGNNTYSGTTTVSAGTLQIGGGGTTGTLGTAAVTNNAALVFNRSNAMTVANAISGTGSVTQSGAGTTTLTSANTYSGGTTISAGTLQVGNSGTTGSLGSGAIVNNSNLTYLFGGTTAVATPQNYSGTGNLSLTGGMVWYPANLNVGGNLSINSITSSNAWLNTQTNVNPVITVGGTTSISGYLAGRSGGANTLSFNSTGAVTMNNIVNGVIGNFWEWDTLNVNAGTSAINVTGNSVMVQNTFDSTWNLTGAVNITGNIAGSPASGGTQNLAINATGNGSISGVLSSTIGLTKSGASTLTLSGNNTHTRATTISGGTLQIGNGGTTGSLGTAGVTNNANLTFNRSNAMSVANVISGTGTVTQSGSGTTSLTSANTYGGTTTISGGTLQIGSGGTTGSLGTAGVTNNANLTFNRSDAISVANVISGTGSVTKSSAGTTTLTGANTYTGATTVNSGTLRAGVATSAFGNNSATTVAGGAFLDLAGFSNTIGSLAGAGTVSSSNATPTTLTAGGDNTSTTFSGIIQNGTGTMSLTKLGTGVTTLSGNNTYTGATDVNGGTLRLGAANRIADTSALSIGASGIFDLNNFSETVASITNNGGVTMGTGNTLTTTNAQTHTGTISGGTATLASTAGGAITANNVLNDFTGNLSISTTGAASVVDANSLTLGTVSASTFSARALGGNLTLGGNITTTGAGDAIVLDTSDTFSNAGNFTLSPGTGRYLVFNGNTTSASINKGSTLTGFNRYGCLYNAGAPSCAAGTDIPATGSGFYFAFAPSLTVSGLSATNKIYDGNAAVTITGTPSLGGVLYGDTITLDASGAAFAFNNKNVGTGKTVTGSGYALGGTNHGYLLTQPSLTADITARPLTINSITAADKTFDNSVAATISAFTFDDAVAGDVLSVAGIAGTFDTPAIGVSKTVTISAGTLAGADSTNYAFTLGTATDLADITASPPAGGGGSGSNGGNEDTPPSPPVTPPNPPEPPTPTTPVPPPPAPPVTPPITDRDESFSLPNTVVFSSQIPPISIGGGNNVGSGTFSMSAGNSLAAASDDGTGTRSENNANNKDQQSKVHKIDESEELASSFYGLLRISPYLAKKFNL